MIQSNSILYIDKYKITDNLIKQALDLDYLYYPPEYHLDFQTCKDYYNNNDDIYIMAINTDTNSVIGYINISPISKSSYDLLLEGNNNDTFLKGTDILPYKKNNEYYVYLSSVVVKKEYRYNGIGSTLIKHALNKILLLAENNIFVSNIVADAISSDGIKICEKLNMNFVKKSNSNSSIFELSFLPWNEKNTILNKQKIKSLIQKFTMR